jgi:hypothetical protein
MITEAGTLSVSHNQTGKGQKAASKGRDPRVISNVHPQQAPPTDPKAALTDLEGASTAPVAATLVIWTGRLRIDRVADLQASAPRIFNAAGSIDLVAVEDSAVIALVVEDSVAAALAALADSVAADSEADDEN